MRDRRAEGYSEKAESLHGKRWDREEAQISELLTSEPEPCEDCGDILAEIRAHAVMQDEDGYSARFLLTSGQAVSKIDSYASRLVQEARDDERRRCADRAVAWWNEDSEDGGPGDIRVAILQGTEPAKMGEDVEVVDRLREALEPFAEADCEDEKYSDEDNPQLLSCEEYGRPRAEWCAVCNAKEALAATEPTTVELPKCDHCGASCGTDCDGSSNYTPDGRQ
jgi:hypothetical protein